MIDDANTNKQFRLYDEHGKFMRLSVDETIARGLNYWENWSCSAGIRGLYIDYDGNLWRCNTASSKLDRFNFDEWFEVVDKFYEDNLHVEKSSDWRNKTPPEVGAEYRKKATAYSKPLSLKNVDNEKKYPGFLGNIDEDFIIPDDWFACPWKSCGCGADVILSKVKDKKYLPLLSVSKDGYWGKEQTMKNWVEEVGDSVAVEMNFPIDYQILWDIGRRCNYNCSYCWPSVHNKSSPHLDFELIKKTTDKLIEKFSKGQTIRWNFGGGEPTLHPQFIEWMKYLKDRNQWTMVTTNGSHSAKFWTECVKYMNSINMSAHFDGIKEERFIDNVKIICEHFDEHDDDHWLEVKLMTPPQYIERGLRLKEEILKSTSISTNGANNRIKGVLSLVPIRSMGDSSVIVEYTDEQLKLLQNQ